VCEALRSAGARSFTFSLGDCIHDLNSGAVTLAGRDLAELDAIVVKKLAPQNDPAARLRLHLLRDLERRGVRVFSRPDVVERVMDRYAMNMAMARSGLPLPRTFSLETHGGLTAALSILGKAVVKPVYTSKGQGMFLADDATDLEQTWQANRGRWLVQEFVRSPGRDIGACVLGGRYIGAFYRVAAAGEWMTTTAAGGRYEACELSAEGIAIAVKAADICGLDYTVADLVESPEGLRIYEVSAFGGFTGLWQSQGQDVAWLYAQHILRDVAGR
jgi:ribosomal protein S6--L-glutamate ligase